MTKDHEPQGRQWLVAMKPGDKDVMDSAVLHSEASDYREVILLSLQALHPDAKLALRNVGDLNTECPGMIRAVSMIYMTRTELTKQGFVEYMDDLYKWLDVQYKEVRGD